MAIDVLVTSSNITEAPAVRELLEYIQKNEAKLGLSGSVAYYDFPTYTDYDGTAHRPDVLLVSPRHGVVAFRCITGRASAETLVEFDESLSQFCSLLITKLLKSRLLRANMSTLAFEVGASVLCFDGVSGKSEIELSNSELLTSLAGLEKLLDKSAIGPLSEERVAELRSVIEGAKALARPQKRIVQDPKTHKLAASLAQLEQAIANFDQRQRYVALANVPGPQRIRGLAGSGKTVILALKAAYLHANNPEARILVTFMTSSLRATLEALIAKFHRHFKDDDPDWRTLHVRHGWGKSTMAGTYSEASRRAREAPMAFGTANVQSKGKDPFGYACRTLLDTGKVEPHYDHVLIDEGQDFPGPFYELCFALAIGERDRKNIVYAYDELQNVFDVKMPSPELLFGTDVDGEPRVSLQRSRQGSAVQVDNDLILRKCYRNQREVLVAAHALGFGIYGDIVQLLESAEHWEDVGYEVVDGAAMKIGTSVKILRPDKNSPLNLSAIQETPVIDFFVAGDYAAELEWGVERVLDFLAGGLQPEDILIIALDRPWNYLRDMARALNQADVSSNNISDKHASGPFTLDGKVTLSAVYKAKGNEAAAVIVMGVDAVTTNSRSGRNQLFTAMTRTKAWLRISGVGRKGTALKGEIDRALEKLPYLEFKMPDLNKIETIQRGFTEDEATMKKALADWKKRLLKEGMSEEAIDDMIIEHGLDTIRPNRFES